MCRLAQRERCAGWPIERALWRRPGHARCRTCRAPLATAGSTAPKPPHQHRTQHQHAARHAAECCTGVQQTLRRCGASSPNPRRAEQARGGTALHWLQEVRASQWKDRVLSHHPQLCATQGTGYAAQSRLPGCPKGCLWTAWKRVLASSAAMPSARASEQRESGEESPWGGFRRRLYRRVRESKPLCAAFKSEWFGLGRSKMEESAIRRHEALGECFGFFGLGSGLG